MSGRSGSPYFDIDAGFETVLNMAESEFAEGWLDLEEGTKVVRTAKVLADWIKGSSESLVSDKYSHDFWKDFPNFVTRLGLHHEVCHALQIELGREYCTETASMMKRSMAAVQLVALASPQPVVQRYLRRASRCYILGLQAECTVMCRAVLENAVSERYNREKLPQPATSEGKSAMKTRLSWARQAGWITSKSESDAWTIWLRGNKAAHDDPEVSTDALSTLTLTLEVLKELYDDRPD